jgi:ABC-type spermidine/putrescine transport system permease subunit II
VSPEINAISTIVVAITAIAILIAWRNGAFRGEERRANEDAEPIAT